MPFINREINRLKILKNIELKKNKSLNILPSKKKVRITNLKRSKFSKIYSYYHSKNKIEEIIMYQKIKKLRKDLKEKQEREKKEYNDIFHKNYPLENENEYNNEIQEILKDKKERFDLLNQKFQKKKEEQNIKIKKIILNRQIKEMERNNNNDDNDNDINIYDGEKRKNKNNFFNSPSHYKLNNSNNVFKNNKENGKFINSKLKSRVFTFYARGNLYKTIII